MYNIGRILHAWLLVLSVIGITSKQKGTEELVMLDVERVFISGPDAKPITDFMGSWVTYREYGVVQMDDKMTMNVPSVYAIGDIQNTPYKQVVIAALDGCRQSNYKYSNRSNV